MKAEQKDTSRNANKPVFDERYSVEDEEECVEYCRNVIYEHLLGTRKTE